MTDKKTTVFVSYRRDDSGASAALLSYVLEQDERLTVLIDVDSIEIGRDYRDAIVEQITNADVVLAVIGRGWVSASDNKDGRRLDDVRDPVRLEIETALRLKKRLVPVLVDDASIPQGEDLPR
ncbi:MAG: toll/interleukin-1 receptor domain-containing protein, partial [Actinomycetes bacterium]